jgi:hypothetical protein
VCPQAEHPDATDERPTPCRAPRTFVTTSAEQ